MLNNRADRIRFCANREEVVKVLDGGGRRDRDLIVRAWIFNRDLERYVIIVRQGGSANKVRFNDDDEILLVRYDS